MEHTTRNRPKVKQFQRVNASIEVSETYYFKGHWVTVFTTAFTKSVRPLTQRQRQVFDVLIDKVRSQNLVRIQHSEIANIIGITSNSVSKAISALCKRGVICKHHDYVYEIDPGILWFGKRRDYFDPPSNPTSRTHQAIQVHGHGKLKTTLHYPHVLTYEQYQRRYGRGGQSKSPVQQEGK
jgi:hypothetical protein